MRFVRPRRFGTANPFPPPDLAKQMADLLLTDNVQRVQFSFGSVLIMPEGFRAVSKALVGPSPTLHVRVDPNSLDRRSDAEYDSVNNLFTFRRWYMMGSPYGRATAVHEATHAVADYRRRSTSVRSEEGAAFVAEAWFLLNCGDKPMRIPERVIEVAAALKSRATSSVGPVKMYASEINDVRREMMNLDYPEKDQHPYYDDHNGIG